MRSCCRTRRRGKSRQRFDFVECELCCGGGGIGCLEVEVTGIGFATSTSMLVRMCCWAGCGVSGVINFRVDSVIITS